jgi:glycosyltransferase involved in cell wall biosynthesis
MENLMYRRVLYIAYTYPPIGGAGVQRTSKFVKYLPQFGWLPSVLTVANPSVPLLDTSLGRDIPDTTLVRRARTWEPSYAVKASLAAARPESGRRHFSPWGILKRLTRRLTIALLQPDPQILWLPAAIRAGKGLLHEHPHHAIVVSGPPFSSFLIGVALSRWSGLPLIMDYRDEWDLSNAYLENKGGGRLSHYVQMRMQRLAVRSARALMATTRASAEALEQLRIDAGSKARVTWIYNGYDPDDFAGSPASETERGVYRLAYVGTLWNLTDATPLVEGILALGRREPALVSRLELVFAGRRTPAQQQVLERLQSSPCRLVLHPYLDHDAALGLVRSAAGLCVLLSDSPGAERVVPAKIFEYMAARRPIVAICPKGEVWDILGHYPAAHLCLPSEPESIAGCLASEIRRHLDECPPDFDAWDASLYSRRTQAAQLADLLASVSGGQLLGKRPASASWSAPRADQAGRSPAHPKW